MLTKQEQIDELVKENQELAGQLASKTELADQLFNRNSNLDQRLYDLNNPNQKLMTPEFATNLLVEAFVKIHDLDVKAIALQRFLKELKNQCKTSSAQAAEVYGQCQDFYAKINQSINQ